MTAKSIISYGFLLLVLSTLSWLVITSWRSYAEPTGRVVYAEQREVVFEIRPRAYLEPVLDTKRHLIARWPESSGDQTIPKTSSEQTTDEIKSALYAAFVSDDMAGAYEELSRVSWRHQPSYSIASLSAEELGTYRRNQWPIVRANNARFELQDVVEALDTTWLLAAYLLDRMNENERAQRLYRQYVRLLELIEEPGASRSYFQLSRRKSAVRARLEVLTNVPDRHPSYDEHSYFLTLISVFLHETLAHPSFGPYREAGYGQPGAARPQRLDFPEGVRVTNYDLPALSAHYLSLSPQERAYAGLERCAFNVSSRKFWGTEKCDAQLSVFALQEDPVLAGLVTFKAFRTWVQNLTELIFLDYSDGTLPLGLKVTWLTDLVLWVERVKPLLVKQNGFLADDLVYWQMEALEALGEKRQSELKLCELAGLDPQASDFSHLARFFLRVSDINCS